MTKWSLRPWRAMPAALLSLALVACGGDDGGTDPDVRDVASIEIDLALTQLEYASSATAQAIAYDEDGDALDDVSVHWSSSDEDVFEVTAAGTITATGAGSAHLTASAGDASDEIEITVVPRTLALVARDASVTEYGMLYVALPAGIGMPASAVPALIGDDTLYFSAAGPDTLGALVMGVGTGTSSLRLLFDGNNEGLLDVTIAAAPVIADPDAEIAAAETHVDAIVAQLEALETETGEAITGLAAVQELAAQFALWADTASAESRQAVAQFLAANQQPMGAPLRGQTEALCVLLSQQDTREEVLYDCADATAIAALAAAGGMWGMSSCAGGPLAFPICLAAAATAGTGWVYALESLGAVFDQAGLIFEEDMQFSLGSSNAPPRTSGLDAAMAGELSFVSGTSYPLVASATYRSATSADNGGPFPKLYGAIASMNSAWEFVQTQYQKLKERFGLSGSLPAPPAAAPATADVMAEDAVPAEYLTFSTTDGDVVVAFDKAAGSIRATLLRGLEKDFTLNGSYSSPLDAFVDATTASVKVDAAIEIVSGNEQPGTPGEPLDEDLIVRVTDVHTGEPVPGVTVEWSVISGGGSLSSATSTTNSAGQASVGWTLGTADDDQIAQATVEYADGSPVQGGPVEFTAGTDLEGVYALTHVNGSAIPTIVYDEEGYVETATGGSLTLAGTGYVMVLNMTYEDEVTGDSGSDDLVLEGTWVADGSSLTFTNLREDGEAEETPWTFTATVSGNVLQVLIVDEEESDTLTFAK